MQDSGDAAAVADIVRGLAESEALNQQLAAYITQLESQRYPEANPTAYELDCRAAQAGPEDERHAESRAVQEDAWQAESRAAEFEDDAVDTENWDGSSPIPPQLSPMDLFLNADLAASMTLYRRGPGGSERRPSTAAAGSAPPGRHASRSRTPSSHRRLYCISRSRGLSRQSLRRADRISQAFIDRESVDTTALQYWRRSSSRVKYVTAQQGALRGENSSAVLTSRLHNARHIGEIKNKHSRRCFADAHSDYYAGPHTARVARV